MIKKLRLGWIIGIAAALLLVAPLAVHAAEPAATPAVTTGFCQDASGDWYYYKNGSSVTRQNLYQDKAGAIGKAGDWYYVTAKGKVDFTFNSLAQNRDSGNWWVVTDGRVDKSYTGFVQNKDSGNWWYASKGKVTKKKNGIIKDTAGVMGTAGEWWYVVKSRVKTDYTGLSNYKSGKGYYYYIKKGKVDRSYNGTAKNKKGKWNVKNGKAVSRYKQVTVIAGDSIMTGMYSSSYNGISKIKVSGKKYVVAAGSLNTRTFKNKKSFNGKTGVQKIASYKPTRVYIMLGMNEVTWKSDSDVRKDYKALIKSIKKACPDADIVVLALSPVTKAKASKVTGFKKVDHYNKVIKKVAKDTGCSFYDYTSGMKDSSGYLKASYSGGDGIHWSSAAYAKFGKLITAYDKSH